MHWPGRIGIGAGIGVGALLGAGWLGLHVEPASFPPYPERSGALETAPIPGDLPPPVARYLRAIAGDRLPQVESAVITGRAQLRLFGLTFPSRVRFTHLAGQGYRHYIESTWFGHPIMKVDEWYLDGHARQELPFGVVVNEPKVDMAANLNLWGEAIWFPSMLVSPHVRWEAVDDATARLIVPFEQTEDSFTVRFDEETGLIRWMEALRYREARDEARIPWRFAPREWRVFHGVRIPSVGAIHWTDQPEPWFVMSVEHVVYNADVSQYVRASGL
jgi:hypothetical protein